MPQYKGNLNPLVPRYFSTPVYLKQESIGKNDRFDSRIKIYVQESTPQFPRVGIKLALSNGAGKVFVTVTIEEIAKLVEFFKACYDEVSVILPTLQAKEAIVNAQLKEAAEKMAQLQQLGFAFNKDEPEGD